MTRTMLFNLDLNESQIREFMKKIKYSIEGLRGCSINEHSRLVIKLSRDDNISEIEDIVAQLEKEFSQMKFIPEKRIIRKTGKTLSMDYRHLADEIFDPTVANGLAIDLYEKIDRVFIKLANEYEAAHRRYKSLIPRETLDKCGYINNFPQNIFFVNHYPHNYIKLKKVNEGSADDLTEMSGYVLSPAVCFHCYEELEGARIDEPVILTSKGRCFRHEADCSIDRCRFLEFDMREIVFIGSEDFVQNTRMQLLEKVWVIFEHLGLSGYVETAHDPFYYPGDYIKSSYQLIGNMKYELIAEFREGLKFTIASFNNMRTTLCNQFDIRMSTDADLNSGCVAFGLDRWVYALLVRYGIDYREWPEEVRHLLDESDVRQVCL